MFAARGGFLAQPSSANGSMYIQQNTTGNSPDARIYCTPNTDLVQWYATTGWTIEYWIYIPSYANITTTGWNGPGNHNGEGYDYWTFYVTANGELGFYSYPSGIWNTSSSLVPAAQWVSVALTAQTAAGSSTIRMFINGVLQLTQAGITGPQSATATPFSIGGRQANQTSTYYLDELRVSNICRYTSTYTPATSPFTSDANTVLLMHFTGSNGSQTFTDSGPNNFTFTDVNPGYPVPVEISTAQYKF